MKKGKSMYISLGVLALGIVMVIWAVFQKDNGEDTAVKTYAENLNRVADLTKTKVDQTAFDQFLKDLSVKMDDFQKVAMDRITSQDTNINALCQALDKLKKQSDFDQARLHGMDKRISSQPKTLNLNLNKPVPVEIISGPPPASKGKGKGALLNKAGVTNAN